MTKLWPLLAVCLVAAWMIDQRQQQLLLTSGKRQEYLFTGILILILGFFCGLRTRMNDTGAYLHMFDIMPEFKTYIAGEGLGFAGGYGFGLLTSLMKTLSFTSQDFLIFFAFLTITSYVLFVKRYSYSMLLGIFLMFTTGMYGFTLAAIKQCAATAICLLALPLALKKKRLFYILLVGCASLFHPYALIYMIVPFMLFKPLTIRTYICIAICLAIGLLLEFLLGTILSVTDMMGADYSAEELSGSGVNIFRVLVCFVPLILAFLYGNSLFRNSSPADDLMFNLAMVNALIMFIGLFGTANYFARLANYFLPAQVITLPWIIKNAPMKDRKLLAILCVVGYLGYFVYENGINGSFDSGYSNTPLWEYLATLLNK